MCTYTQDKHNDNIVSGVLGEGAPSPSARGLGERCKLPPAGSGAEPRRPTDFSHFGVPGTVLLRNEAPEHA